MILCEYAIWKTLPVIRRRLAVVLVKEMGRSQREVSKMLGISEAAVSNYVKGKRGNKRIEEKVSRRIRASAKRISVGGDVNKEICNLCRYFMKTKNIIPTC
jgi:predicted transcriptional regulator